MRKLLRSELLVLLGMVEDGTRTDTEIADVHGLKRGTVASTRRRLVDSGFIAHKYLPAFNKLGCEMLGFHLGTADLSVSLDQRASQYIEFCSHAPQIFFGILEGHSALFYAAFRNGTDAEGFVQQHNRYFSGSMRNWRTNLHSCFFPYPLTRGTFRLNLASIIHMAYGLDLPTPRVDMPRRERIEPPEFSDSEKDVIISLVENPAWTDERVSSEVGLSRQAVTKTRNRLLERGIITPAWIPNFARLGFEIYVAAYARLASEIPWDQITQDSEPKEALHLSFFTLSKGDDIVANYVNPNFQFYSKVAEKAMSAFEVLHLFDSKPELVLFSLERATQLRYFEFGPAVRYALEPSPAT